MTAPPPEDQESVVAYRLQQIERQLAHFESITERRFKAVGEDLRNLGFVRADVFREYQTRVGDRIDTVERAATGARTIATSILLLLVSIIGAGLLGLLISVASS